VSSMANGYAILSGASERRRRHLRITQNMATRTHRTAAITPPMIDPDMTFFLEKPALDDAPDCPGAVLERLLNGSPSVAVNVAPTPAGPPVGSDKPGVRGFKVGFGAEVCKPVPELTVEENRADDCVSGKEVDVVEGFEGESVIEGDVCASGTDEDSCPPG